MPIQILAYCIWKYISQIFLSTELLQQVGHLAKSVIVTRETEKPKLASCKCKPSEHKHLRMQYISSSQPHFQNTLS